MNDQAQLWAESVDRIRATQAAGHRIDALMGSEPRSFRILSWHLGEAAPSQATLIEQARVPVAIALFKAQALRENAGE